MPSNLTGKRTSTESSLDELIDFTTFESLVETKPVRTVNTFEKKHSLLLKDLGGTTIISS